MNVTLSMLSMTVLEPDSPDILTLIFFYISLNFIRKFKIDLYFDLKWAELQFFNVCSS